MCVYVYINMFKEFCCAECNATSTVEALNDFCLDCALIQDFLKCAITGEET